MSDHAERLDPNEHYSATHLFIRGDERVHGIEAELVGQGKDLQDIKSQVKAVEDRVNLGVARTGNENKKDIDDLKTRMALVEKSAADFQTRIFDKDSGIVRQLEELRGWVERFKNNVVTFFIVQCAGALILWAVKHFR